MRVVLTVSVFRRGCDTVSVSMGGRMSCWSVRLVVRRRLISRRWTMNGVDCRWRYDLRANWCLMTAAAALARASESALGFRMARAETLTAFAKDTEPILGSG